MYKRLRNTTSSTIISTLVEWFHLLGWPQSIRSDNGPQFLGPFKAFCNKHSISHETSAPLNSRANGLAESGVKIIKGLLKKCISAGQDPEMALYEWRNFPRAHGFSPAQLMFGRQQRLELPQHRSAFSPIDFNAAARARDRQYAGCEESYNRDKKLLSPLQVGQAVLVQDQTTGLWNRAGKVKAVRPDQLSYSILLSSGRELVRTRYMLKPDLREFPSAAEDLRPATSVSPSMDNKPQPQPLRRSPRFQQSSASCASTPLPVPSTLSPFAAPFYPAALTGPRMRSARLPEQNARKPLPSPPSTSAPRMMSPTQTRTSALSTWSGTASLEASASGQFASPSLALASCTTTVDCAPRRPTPPPRDPWQPPSVVRDPTVKLPLDLTPPPSLPLLCPTNLQRLQPSMPPPLPPPSDIKESQLRSLPLSPEPVGFEPHLDSSPFRINICRHTKIWPPLASRTIRTTPSRISLDGRPDLPSVVYPAAGQLAAQPPIWTTSSTSTTSAALRRLGLLQKQPPSLAATPGPEIPVACPSRQSSPPLTTTSTTRSQPPPPVPFPSASRLGPSPENQRGIEAFPGVSSKEVKKEIYSLK